MGMPDCGNFFNCENGKQSKDLSWDMFWKFLIVNDGDGCPAFKVSGNIDVTASVEAPENSAVGDVLIEEDDNTTLQASIAAWRVANPTKKQISIVNCNSISKQSVIISYTS